MFAFTAVTAALSELVASVFMFARGALVEIRLFRLLQFHHPPLLLPALIGTESGSATRIWPGLPRPAIAMAWKLVSHQRLGCGSEVGLMVTTPVQPLLYANWTTALGV